MNNVEMNYIKKENIPEFKESIHDFYRETPLRVLEVEKGTILPARSPQVYGKTQPWMGLGGVLDRDMEFISLSGIEATDFNGLVFGGKYDIDESRVEYCDEVVVYMGLFIAHWGHFLLEYCTRLWYVIEKDVKYKIVFVKTDWENNSFEGPYVEFLNLLGIEKSQMMFVEKPTQFKKIIIPEQSYLRNKYYTKNYTNLISYVKNNVNLSLPVYEKIYFSRKEFVKNNCPQKEHGEEAIEKSFQINGFKVLYPEKMSTFEQIWYVKNCKQIVVAIGGAGCNTVFLDRGATAVFLEKMAVNGGDTLQICQSAGVEKIVYIDCYRNIFPQISRSYGAGPHCLAVTRELVRFLKDHEMNSISCIQRGLADIDTFLWISRIAFSDYYKKVIHSKSDIHYIFPADKIPEKSRLIIYAGGKVGKSYIKYLKKDKRFSLVLWVDKNYNKVKKYKGYTPCGVEAIKNVTYDYILIAVGSKELADAISVDLKNEGIDEKKLLWFAPQILKE